MILNTAFCFLVCGSFCFGQTYEQLMSYSHYYSKDIDAFKEFINKEPAATHSNYGIQQVVYEFHNHSVGLEEHKSDNGKIGEIYVFQTNENHTKANYEWRKYFDSLNNNPSFQFVKAIFDDGVTKDNNLTLENFTTLLNSKNINSDSSYGVRYKKSDVYYSLFVIKGKLVFTVDDKNF